MSAGKHTPGPWRVWPEDNLTVVAGDGEAALRVCDTYDDAEWVNVADDSATAAANATLIAAAPDLLEALEDLSGLIRRGWTLAVDIEVSWALDRAEAALAKARGE